MARSCKQSRTILLALTLLAAAPAWADDLGGAQGFLCVARELFTCVAGGDCARVDPDEINVPDFVLVDLAAKELRTTAASGENRITAIRQSAREEGLLFLQGIENGRAWSFTIAEETGRFTASVAREELSVSAFGVCTPAPAVRP